MLIRFLRLFPDARPPERASPGAVGFDARAYHVIGNIHEHKGELPAEIEPGGKILIGIGIAFVVPPNVDCQVRPRSGLANKYGIELSNSPGTIDPDYRGEASILLRNRSTEPFTVEKGMRIAQLVFTEVEIPKFLEIDKLPETSRGSGGFGSTGLSEIALGDKEYLDEQGRWDKYFMEMTQSASLLSNCLRGAEKNPGGSYKKDCEGRYCGAIRRFGCVIVKDHNVITQGCNMRGAECGEEKGCVRERENIPSGTFNERGCFHAEIVAFQNHARTGGPSLKDATVYINAEPCVMCADLLLGCGISAVVVPHGIYPTNGLNLILGAGIEVRYVRV